MTPDASVTLEPFRKYLTVLADLHLDRKLRGKPTPPMWSSRRCTGVFALAEASPFRPRCWSPGCGGILAKTLAERSTITSGTSGTSPWSGRWRPTWTAPRRGSQPDWPPTSLARGRAERNEELLRMSRPWRNCPSLWRGGRLEALPGLDAAPDRRADRPQRPGRRLAVAARPGRVAQPAEVQGMTRDDPQ